MAVSDCGLSQPNPPPVRPVRREPNHLDRVEGTTDDLTDNAVNRTRGTPLALSCCRQTAEREDGCDQGRQVHPRPRHPHEWHTGGHLVSEGQSTIRELQTRPVWHQVTIADGSGADLPEHRRGEHGAEAPGSAHRPCVVGRLDPVEREGEAGREEKHESWQPVVESANPEDGADSFRAEHSLLLYDRVSLSMISW